MPRRRKPKPKPRHWLNVFRYIPPAVAWKAAAGIGIWAGSLVGVSHKAGVENAGAVNGVEASATVAVYAAEQADSLRVDVARIRRRLAVLERAVGEMTP